MTVTIDHTLEWQEIDEDTILMDVEEQGNVETLAHQLADVWDNTNEDDGSASHSDIEGGIKAVTDRLTEMRDFAVDLVIADMKGSTLDDLVMFTHPGTGERALFAVRVADMFGEGGYWDQKSRLLGAWIVEDRYDKQNAETPWHEFAAATLDNQDVYELVGQASQLNHQHNLT